MKSKITLGILIVLLAIGAFFANRWWQGHRPVYDTAYLAGKTPADFPQTASRWFDAMDAAVPLTDNERMGRNTWLLWTGGNQDFWDYMATHSFGTVDFLRIIDSREREKRFSWYGIINDPDYEQAKQPDKWGLWLDTPKGALPTDPDAPADLKIDPQVYGYSTGVVGLRLYPNPEFDAEAQKKWDAKRYYSDRNYYYDPKLVRPYKVGLACGFCHVAPHPLNPPAHAEHPEWANLSSNIGNQYFWTSRIFGFDLKDDNFIWQVFNTNLPGALDTSFIATDNITNPRTMNAIYNVSARLGAGSVEQLGNNNLHFHDQSPQMKVPHILKDGSDSIGILGALSRVYVNIGEYHQEWLRHHNALLGGKRQTPFPIETAKKNSVYWQASEQRVDNLAAFFVKAAVPMPLAAAPTGNQYLSADASLLNEGKRVFADHCASCHSSKQPDANLKPGTDAYRDAMRTLVMQTDFLDNNYLSDEQRHPITEIGTNACSALATNSTAGHVWDNFSSDTYKNLPSVGTIKAINPLTSAPYEFPAPAGGPGYVRTPSLIGLWASAPFFVNNALGKFSGDPSVASRVADYNDAIEKLLWPDRRDGLKSIYTTTAVSYIKIHRSFLPPLLQELADDNGDLVLGPIPKGTPVGLLSSLNLSVEDPKHLARLLKVVFKVKKDLLRIKKEQLNDAEAAALLSGLVPDLMSVSNCPDYVNDRGHLYGSQLPEADKRALIEYLKFF